MAYLMTPSGFQSRQAEGPKVLTELLEMAQESQPFNPDPYISSTYRPGDPLYEPVLAIQRERWDIAKKLLQPLVEQGNADAMYWLAHISGGSIYAGKEIARLFRKSAELGNPYAALRLDVSSEDCSLYLRGYCDPKWGKLGRKLLQERAEKGDKKAEYYLLQYDENSSEEVHKELERLVTENAKNHYYQPLIRMMIDYNSQSYLTYFQKSKELSNKKRKLISEIALLAVNNNFPPAMYNIFYNMSDVYEDNVLSKIINQCIKLTSRSITCAEYNIDKPNRTRHDILIGAAYSYMTDIINHGTNKYSKLTIFKSYMNRKGVEALNSDENSEVISMAKEMLEKMTPVIYIDEMNPRP